MEPIQLPYTSADRAKVEGANSLYLFVAELARWCIAHDVGFSIENPANSWFWQAPGILALSDDPSVSDVCFEACRHGGRRPKKCRWRTNVPALSSLEGACPGGHTHLPWGVSRGAKRWDFATEAEAEYPEELCAKVAAVIAQNCASAQGPVGHEPAPAPTPRHDPDAELRQQRQAAAGTQPRRGPGAQLVPEFREIVHVQVVDETEQAFVRAWKGALK